VTEIAQGIAACYGAVATVNYKRLYPPTVIHPAETTFAVDVARAVAGEDNVDADRTPLMGSEDFAFMPEERPGNIILIGNGDTAGCHDPAYDFNDAAIPYAVSYWIRLIEMAMPTKP
jgi:metal-dependent amidase/aminoacylase/carboxypeptidase family protein